MPVKLSPAMVALIEQFHGAPKNQVTVYKKRGSKWNEMMYQLEAMKSLYITYTVKGAQTPDHESITFGLTPIGGVLADIMYGDGSDYPKWMPPPVRKPVLVNGNKGN